MANKPVAAYGIKIKYGTAAASLTQLYSITSVPEGGGARENIDVTTLADDARVGMPGIKANDALEFNGLKGKFGAKDALPTALVDEYAALKALDSQTAYYWEIEWPDGSKDDWQGYPDVRSASQEINGAPAYILSIIPATGLSTTPAPSGT